MIIDREFIIDNDMLTLYTCTIGFPWDTRKEWPFSKRLKFPMEIKMLNPKEGRMLFFLLKINFESQKLKDTVMYLMKDDCTLIINENTIAGKNKYGHKTLIWDEKITKRLYDAMVKYYKEKKITNDDFLDVILGGSEAL